MLGFELWRIEKLVRDCDRSFSLSHFYLNSTTLYTSSSSLLHQLSSKKDSLEFSWLLLSFLKAWRKNQKFEFLFLWVEVFWKEIEAGFVYEGICSSLGWLHRCCSLDRVLYSIGFSSKSKWYRYS